MINDTLNPIFYDVAEFQLDAIDIENAPPVILTLFDTDEGLFDSGDDYLGSAVIHLKDAATKTKDQDGSDELQTPPEIPQWHDFKEGFDQKTAS